MTSETLPFDAAAFIENAAEFLIDAVESGDARVISAAIAALARAIGIGEAGWSVAPVAP